MEILRRCIKLTYPVLVLLGVVAAWISAESITSQARALEVERVPRPQLASAPDTAGVWNADSALIRALEHARISRGRA